MPLYNVDNIEPQRLGLVFYDLFMGFTGIQISYNPQGGTSQSAKDMELKSRIKSMTQYSVKGARIFPTQLLAADVNKSMQLQGIGQRSFQKVTQSNHVLTPQHHMEELRLSHRHSIEIGGYQRCHTARPSQNFGRFSLAMDNAKVGEPEGLLFVRADHPLKRYSEVRDSEILSKFSENDQTLPTFKSIKTYPNKIPELLPSPLQGNHFDRIKMGATLKQVQQQKAKVQNEEAGMDKIYKKLYIQYRNRYERAQKDNDQLMERFRKVDNSVEELQREKGRLQEELRERSEEGGRVKELEERIVELEESIRTNIRINDALMRKETEYQRKVKDLEHRQAAKVEETDTIKQEMEELGKQCERLRQENIHLDNENLRLDSENVRLSQLYEQLTKGCDQHPKKEAFTEISSRLNKVTSENCLLQQSNQDLHRTLLQLTENINAQYERIDWLQSNHKQLQQNLMETQEELKRIGLQFVNYKLSQQYQDKSQLEQSSNCTPSFGHEEEEKLSQFEANTNHIISSDSDDQKVLEMPHQTTKEDYEYKNDQGQSIVQQQQVYSIA